MKQILDDFLISVNEYYTREKNECSEVMLSTSENLFNYHAEIDLPRISTQSFEQFTELNIDTNNLKIPSPLYIGKLLHNISIDIDPIPALIDFIHCRGLCVESDLNDQILIHQFIQNLGLRIFISVRPDLINPIIIDVEGSGSNFKLLCGLEPAKKNLVFSPNLISERLKELVDNFNKLQTESLTYRYDCLEDMNIAEPQLAKKYNFLFIANFPSGFNSDSCQLLKNIIQNSSRFGTFIFMTYNPEIKLRSGNNNEVSEIIKNLGYIQKNAGRYQIYNSKEESEYNSNFHLDLECGIPLNASNIIESLNIEIKKSGSRAVTQNAYFDKILSGKLNVWNYYLDDDSKNEGLIAPIGIINAQEELNFTIDCDTDNYHAIIGGKTGSGKTILIDNLIINAAINYSPEELQFVLLDFKGASFQKYKKLPHLKILFSGSQRFYGLNVLRYLKGENIRRQEILAERGGKISSLTKVERRMFNFPRLVIILDEFQILLKEMDEIFREASSLLDTLAQQGRSAGIHLILSSQDLTGVTLSDSTQSNSNVRIALKMDPLPCHMIFSRENIEATKLEKKGQAIYNDKSGRPTHGNIGFQVYLLEDKKSRELIDFLNEKWLNSGLNQIDKFVLPNENKATFQPKLIAHPPSLGIVTNSEYTDLFLGEPSFIRLKRGTQEKEHSFIRFKNADNSNILMAGNDLTSGMSIIGLAIYQLLQKGLNFSDVYLFNGFSSDKLHIQSCLKGFTNLFSNYHYFAKNNVNEMVSILSNELERRRANDLTDSSKIFIFLCNPDSTFYKSGFNFPEISQQLNSILKFGPTVSMHVFLYMYSAKTFINSLSGTNGIAVELFETKIVLKGDGLEITGFGIQKKEPEKNSTALLFAPEPITTINPDLFNIYNSIQRIDIENTNDSALEMLNEFFKEVQ